MIKRNIKEKGINKLKNAKFLSDPNDPEVRKTCENFEEKLKKIHREKIPRYFDKIAYTRFWSRDKSAVKKEELGTLKRIKQSSDHSLKSKILCPIYTCFETFDSSDKANEHMREKHQHGVESSFNIKKNGKLEFTGDLDKMMKNVLLFSKIQSMFVQYGIIDKGNAKLEELKKEFDHGKSKFNI